MALTNYLMDILDLWLVTLKFDTVRDVMASVGVFSGAVYLTLFSSFFAVIAATLVCFVSGPMCQGSGIPEAKGYPSGNHIPGLFNSISFFVRVLAIVLAVAAGFPIGREGPMVCIGGSVGYVCMHFFAKEHVKVHLDMAQRNNERGRMSAFIKEEERFTKAKRVGFALGGATGIATALNAPIGGVLYMFEEVTVAS